VPHAVGDPRRATITVQPIGPRSITLNPYPFRQPELHLAVPVRELENRPYESAQGGGGRLPRCRPREMVLTLSR